MTILSDGLNGAIRAACAPKLEDRRRLGVPLQDALPSLIEGEAPPGAAGPLDADPTARATFDGLSYSNKSWLAVTVTNMPETRARRIERSIAALGKGRVR